MHSDFRFALRMIATHPWFSLVVVVTLALGIGANTTVFTLVNAVLFKPVPVPGGARLVTLAGQDLNRPENRRGLSYPDYLEFRQNSRSFESVEAVTGVGGIISEAGATPDRFIGQRVTPGLFTMLKTPPVLGRGFIAADGQAGAPEVLLISHKVWKNRYGGDPSVVGRAVRFNSKPATIIGVMPDGFHFPQREDIWAVLSPTPDLEKRANRWLQVFAILKPGTPIEAAGSDVSVIAQRLAKEFPDTNKDSGIIVRTFHDTFNGGRIRNVFLTLLGAVGFVLLIACANVANLMLSRALGRQREIAVRAALGASRWQIIRQLLVESVLLSSLGGLFGLGIAVGGVHLFDLATRDVGKPYWIIFSMDYVVFAYIAAISVLCGILFGLAPALRVSRVDLTNALKDGTLGSGSATAGSLTGILVVVQFAFTVILLAAAGLMIRSFMSAQKINEFVPRERIFTARMTLPADRNDRYHDRAARVRFFEQLTERLGAVPGVSHVAMTGSLPGLGAGTRDIEIEGRPLENAATPPRASTDVHTPGYLAAINLPIIQGRDFNVTDGEKDREAAIVTSAFAAKFFPNQPAVGARFRILEGRDRKPGAWISIVGVSADIIQRPDDADAAPLVYFPYRQEGWTGMTLLVRTTADPSALATQVRAILQQLDADLPLFDVRTLNEALARNRWFLVVFGSLFLAFALIALLMASIGLYAVVAQATTRRTREIGIRMALGATAERIMRLVLSRGLLQLSFGLVLGLGGAFATTHLLGKSGFLLRVSPSDPLVFVGITLLLITIGVLACWLPARRAAALHPVTALRQE